MSANPERRARISALLGDLAHVVAIGGIIFFFVQEYWQKQRNRVERSVEYYLVFQTGDFREERKALIRPFIQRGELMALLYEGGNKPSRSELNVLMMDALDSNSLAERQSVVEALYSVEGLFRSLRTCIEEGVCDRETAFKVVGKEASEIACFFGPGFRHIERTIGLEDFGEAILYFTNRDDCRHVFEDVERSGT